MDSTSLRRLSRILELYRQQLKNEELIFVAKRTACERKRDELANLTNEIQQLNQDFCDAVDHAQGPTSGINQTFTITQTKQYLARLETALDHKQLELDDLDAELTRAREKLVQQRQKVETLAKLYNARSDQITLAINQAVDVELLDQLLSQLHTSKP